MQDLANDLELGSLKLWAVFAVGAAWIAIVNWWGDRKK